MIRNERPLLLVAALLFLLLLLRLVQLQLVEHEQLQQLAAQNAAKTVPEPAPRGVIYDRHGRVLVENRPVFSVRIMPHILQRKSPEEQRRVLDLLGQLLGEKVELKTSATEPFIIKDHVPRETAIRIEERKNSLDGVVVTGLPVRRSTQGALAAHVLGYVAEIETEELKELRKRGYRLGDIVGKDGVEKSYDSLIRGRDGGKQVEVDVRGTPLRLLAELEPEPGPDVTLTLDLELQRALEAALGRQEGAAVVMDVRHGEILALASNPNYDPNIFSDPQSRRELQRLQGLKHPFMNRALGHYPPGSVFKIVTLAAALEEGKVSLTEFFTCHGHYRLQQRVAKCWLESGHGTISVREGLVWSCNVVFYELGKRLGPELLAKYAEKFGLGERTGIDLPQEKMGRVTRREWKERVLREPWYEGDSINYGIGQGWVQVTPLQMAVAYAALATGRLVKPYVVKEIKGRDGYVIYQAREEAGRELGISAATLNLIRGALREVVDRGTGVAVRFSGVPAAGKTGTAQNPGKPHAWFISYAPDYQPEIVIAAFVVHGEHGDRASAYIARDVLKWYKEHRFKQAFEVPAYTGQYILQRESFKAPYGGSRPKPKPAPSEESTAVEIEREL